MFFCKKSVIVTHVFLFGTKVISLPNWFVKCRYYSMINCLESHTEPFTTNVAMCTPLFKELIFSVMELENLDNSIFYNPIRQK